jgi:glutaredoxin
MTHVTLYSKPGCHLCDEVKAVIMQVARRYRFRLVIKNILDDPHDEERYRHSIPVVCVNGREIARYRLTQADLEAALAEADQPASVDEC